MGLKRQGKASKVELRDKTNWEQAMRSMSIPDFYRTWQRQFLQWLPDDRDSRMTNLIWLMYGILKAGSVHLNRVARHVPVRAKKLSIVKRLARFLDNGAVQVRAWYRPVAERLVQAASSGGTLHLVLDASKVAFGYQLLMVAVGYQGRTQPIAWTWVPYAKGHSRTSVQRALLVYVRGLLPSRAVNVLLVGDSEFGRPLLIDHLKGWGWQYALRQPGDHLILTHTSRHWQRLDSLSVRQGEWVFLEHVLLTQAGACPTHVLVFWAKGEKQPWYIATNLSSATHTIRAYRRRMWVEEMFGDMKGHGFDLETSHLRAFLRLSRLALAVALLYVWLSALGEHLLQTNQTHLVDRHDRRDLSIFRLGLDIIWRCITLDDPFPPFSFSNFCSLSGG
jgi:hypothetical protein